MNSDATRAESARLLSMRATPEGYFTSRFGLPEYTDWQDESLSWKETCYLGDWSFLWERRFRGADAIKLFSDFSVNSFASFAIHQSKHVIHCNTDGKIIHEGILTRLSNDEYMLFGRGGFWIDYMLRQGDYQVTSQIDDWFNFQLSGPSAAAVLERACGTNPRDIRFMHNGVVSVRGYEVLALRQGMAGEPGFELQGPIKYAAEIYSAIIEAGQPFGIRKLGGRAACINHLEACFPTIVSDYLPAIFDDELAAYLTEFKAAMPAFASTFNVAGSFEAAAISDYYRNPVELGWAKNINFDHEFLGCETLMAEKANPQRCIRTLVWNGDDVLQIFASLFKKGLPLHFMELPRDQRGFMWADKVLIGDRLVGVSTSRGYSFSFREMLSLCTIDVDCANIGTKVQILWGNPGEPQMLIRATIAVAPYKQDNRRKPMT